MNSKPPAGSNLVNIHADRVGVSQENLVGFVPNTEHGQNFLIDPANNVVDKIVDAAIVSKDDIILEIGPGLGILTKALAVKAKKVFAVEIDQRLINILEKELRGYSNIELVNKDIREVLGDHNLNALLGCGEFGYKVVANLPYNITSFIIRALLESAYPPAVTIIMVQKEVAERIASQPGKMSILAVSVQYYADASIVIGKIPRTMFWPSPAVDSAVIKIVHHRNLKPSKDFFRLVKIGFSAPRKQLQNNLANGFKIDREQVKKILFSCDLSTECRAQDLSVDDWKGLLVEISSVNKDGSI